MRTYEAFVIGLIKGALINIGYDQVPPVVQTSIKEGKLTLTITVQ